MNKNIYKISGMHCKSCEILIEDKIKNFEGVEKINVNCNKGIAEVYFNNEEPDEKELKKELEKMGYILLDKNSEKINNSDINKKELFSKDIKDYKDLFIAFLIFSTLYMLFSLLKLDKIFAVNFSSDSFSIPTALIVGLAAGVSTCMALVGGLVVGISGKFAEKNQNLRIGEKIKPHLFFNLGRVLGFFILGGLLGLFGSFIKISFGFSGFLTLIVGGVMLLMGLQLLNIFPFISNIKFTLPKSISRFFGISNDREYSHKGTIILGALTFFLPCGFTQAMQLYAISSGSFISGGLIMALFAVGTTPGLIGIGSLASSIKGRFSGIFFKVIGLLVIIFSIFNLNNGYNLALVSASSLQENINKNNEKTNSNTENTGQLDKQIITAIFNVRDDISPTSFKVKANQPVRFEITTLENGSGCMSTIMIPGVYNKADYIKKGLVVLEFTPTKKGTFPITCAMGVKRGVLIVE